VIVDNELLILARNVALLLLVAARKMDRRSSWERRRPRRPARGGRLTIKRRVWLGVNESQHGDARFSYRAKGYD